MEKRPALGKGLSALIPDVPELKAPPTEVDLDLILPNEQQPRHGSDDSFARATHVEHDGRAN